MPGYKKHLLYSIPFLIAAYIIRYSYFSIDPIILLFEIPLFFFYTLLPDIDTPASKIRKIVEVGILFLLLILLMTSNETIISVFFIMILLFLWFSKHRGIFHKPFTGILLSSPVAMYNISSAIICYYGFIVHLIFDKKLK
jgi:hypothetical protein